jgi:hypothetical protein
MMEHKELARHQASAELSFEGEVGRRVTPLDSGCWMFDGSKDPYPDLWVKGQGRLLKAHRWLYEELVGDVPTGHHLHHTCFTSWCVNPYHLVPLTKQQHAAVHRAARAASLT